MSSSVVMTESSSIVLFISGMVLRPVQRGHDKVLATATEDPRISSSHYSGPCSDEFITKG
jgi:hypothetical protein